MFSKCLILFAITIPLILLSNQISEYFNKRAFIRERKNPFVESINGAIFITSVLVFFITLIFAIYIFIFN